LYFQLPYLPEETCFQQAGSFVVEGTSQAVLGSSDERKVSEKIPALLYVGKGPVLRPFSYTNNRTTLDVDVSYFNSCLFEL
jgi:hypothetical protein